VINVVVEENENKMRKVLYNKKKKTNLSEPGRTMYREKNSFVKLIF